MNLKAHNFIGVINVKIQKKVYPKCYEKINFKVYGFNVSIVKLSLTKGFAFS